MPLLRCTSPFLLMTSEHACGDATHAHGLRDAAAQGTHLSNHPLAPCDLCRSHVSDTDTAIMTPSEALHGAHLPRTYSHCPLA